jgi:hypothetical protein
MILAYMGADILLEIGFSESELKILFDQGIVS